MCFLIVAHRVHPRFPLVVGANRDELLRRPAEAMTVLRERTPRILGGRDAWAGGTWLAVNERGVFAGLTNRPSGRDPAKRSRGELPLALARGTSATSAAREFKRRFDPRDFNPCWLLVGDRRDLIYIDMSGIKAPKIRLLKPGIHILENQPLAAASAASSWACKRLASLKEFSEEALIGRLKEVLTRHSRPTICRHGAVFGTRSASIILVAREKEPPRVRFSEGPACRTEVQDAFASWNSVCRTTQ